MRILDRYLLRQFLLPSAYCAAAFWLLIVLFDLLGEKLTQFVEMKVGALSVARYYLLATPEFLVPTIPLSFLLGLLYALSLLAKHHELSAIRASGVSLRRLALPLLAVGALSSGAVFLLNERLVPQTSAAAATLLREVLQEKAGSEETLMSLWVDSTRRYWHGHFHRRTHDLRDLIVRRDDEKGMPLEKIHAARARWLDGEWWFFDGQVWDYTREKFGVPHFESFQELRRADMEETPRLFLAELDERRTAQRASDMTIAELREYIAFYPGQEHGVKMAPYRTRLQERFAQPLHCLIVFLLGVPLGARFHRRGPLLATATALGLLVCFQLMSELTRPLGLHNLIEPWVAVWMPLALFAAVGLWLLARMD